MPRLAPVTSAILPCRSMASSLGTEGILPRPGEAVALGGPVGPQFQPDGQLAQVQGPGEVVPLGAGLHPPLQGRGGLQGPPGSRGPGPPPGPGGSSGRPAGPPRRPPSPGSGPAPRPGGRRPRHFTALGRDCWPSRVRVRNFRALAGPAMAASRWVATRSSRISLTDLRTGSRRLGQIRLREGCGRGGAPRGCRRGPR